ncbi:hypothetical protein [Actinokineospora sp. HUAS TT18]|uniref:hypothetical protein n=1 Tax=Actinokineospora sp. HUAS TT18 TaxID=3447451 RepID=UPI003F527947
MNTLARGFAVVSSMVAGLCLATTPASAGDSSVWIDANGLHYRGTDSSNTLLVRWVSNKFAIRDSRNLTPGNGCISTSDMAVSCSVPQSKRIDFDAAGGNDHLTIETGGLNGFVYGGNGNDTVAVSWRYYHTNGSSVTYSGGEGEDEIDFSSLTYETPQMGVYVTLDDQANDGRAVDRYCMNPGRSRHSDNFRTDFEVLHGSNDDDILIGRDFPTLGDVIQGDDGEDCLEGRSGDDTYYQGTANDGQDRFVEGPGYDTIDYSDRINPVTFHGFLDGGEAGERDWVHTSEYPERILGGTSSDEIAFWGDISGNGGHDILRSNNAPNEIFGGPGNDTITGGGGADLLDCGLGNDTAVQPEWYFDTLISCEIQDYSD